MFTYITKPVRKGALPLAVGALILLSLAGCARLTSVDNPGQVGKYKVDLQIDPKTLNPPMEGTISYAITDAASGKPVSTFETVYGALLHNILISSDMQNFSHTYTGDLIADRAAVFAFYPAFDRYYSYALFKPAGASLQVFTSTITTGDVQGAPPTLVEEPSPVKTQGWLTFELVKQPGAIKRGQPTQLVFNVRERGNPVTALWPYFGSAGHLWVVDSMGGSFAHELASAESRDYALTPLPDQTGTPSVGDSANTQAGAVTGGTGAGGAGPSGTGSGAGTPSAIETPPPPPTYAPNIANALATIAMTTPQYLAPAQQTPQAYILSTPEVLPGIAYGPNLAFTHTFPHAGMYKCWLEVQYRAQVVVVSYVLRVE